VTTYSEMLPETKSEKRWGVKFHKSDDAHSPVCGRVVIEAPGKWCEYRLTEFPTGWDGRGFRLDKLAAGTDPESENYDVFVGRNRQDVRCDCKGFTYGRGKPCKHIAAVVALIGNGWL
jgi:hypothetical protein